jgi:hypothetical protein
MGSRSRFRVSRSSAAPGGWRRIGFDIAAKAEGDIQPGLAGRRRKCFSCCAVCSPIASSSSPHEETRDQPVYLLRLDRSDGKLGPNLRPSTVDCAAMRGANRGGPPPDRRSRVKCRPVAQMFGPGRMMSGGTPIEMLTNGLARLVNRVVIDRTGLTGNYESTLEFTPDQSQSAGRRAAARYRGAPSRRPLALHGAQGTTRLEARIRSRTGPRVGNR